MSEQKSKQPNSMPDLKWMLSSLEGSGVPLSTEEELKYNKVLDELYGEVALTEAVKMLVEAAKGKSMTLAQLDQVVYQTINDNSRTLEFSDEQIQQLVSIHNKLGTLLFNKPMVAHIRKSQLKR